MNRLIKTERLSTAKAGKVHSACQDLLGCNNPIIRQVAHVVGVLVSSLPAVKYGALYHRKLEHNKTQTLKHIVEILMQECICVKGS